MNIVLIVLDCVRPDHAGCYGFPRPTTPALDAFAAENTQFLIDVSAGVWTLPSVTSILTGLYPSQHGLNRQDRRMSDGITLFPERLAEAGYRTACFSANPHVGPTFGLNRGFTDVQEFWGASSRESIGATGNLVDRAYRAALPRLRGAVKRSQFLTKTFRRYQYRGAVKGDPSGQHLADAACRWIEGAKGTGAPFFAMLHFMEAHVPYVPPAEDALEFLSQSELEAARALDQDGMAYMAGANPLTAEQLALMLSLYDASIHHGDKLLAQVLGAVDDDTMVIVTADHGNHFGEKGLMGHFFSVYETLSQVPLVVRHPALQPGVVERPVQSLDIAATVLEAAGLSASRGPSVSLTATEDPRPCLVSEYLDPDLSRFARFKGFDPAPYDRELRAVHRDGWKYIWSSDLHEELYHLSADPKEEHDLAGQEPERLAEMRGLHEAWRAAAGGDAPAGGAQAIAMEPEVAESLRALGYFD